MRKENKKLVSYAVALIVMGALFSVAFIFSDNFPTREQIGEIDETGNFLKTASPFENSEDYLARASGSAKKRPPTPPATSATSFSDSFTSDYKVEETGALYESGNLHWWVNSGAWLISSLGTGKTIQGDLSVSDRWYAEYLKSNSIDTDNGLHPQNIFRLVQSNKWANLTQEAYFKIMDDNLSVSSNRNASNGLFLFNRYQSGDNLYYTGIRVDGYAVIKKKINGVYYTMAYKRFIDGLAYNRDGNPNLLPKNTWLGLRSVVQNNTDGTMSIRMFADSGRTGNWLLIAEAKDDGKSFGGGAILNGGYAGIRTDFMDVEFDDYQIVRQ